MSNILDKHFVLKLNANWVAVGTPSVYDTIVAMCREPTPANGFSRPYFALDIDYPNVNYPPLDWYEWIELPVRPQDNYIQAARKKIRVPTVIIANNYKKVPEKKPKYSKGAVRERDKNTCVYSGTELTRDNSDIDHYLPLDLGGETTFENTCAALKKINRLKRNMHPEEFHKLYPQYRKPNLYKPKAKIIRIENTYGNQDWDLFLKK